MIGNFNISNPPKCPSLLDSTKESLVSCQCLQRFHRFLCNQFYNLGYAIAKSPSYFIIIPVFISLICATGVQNMIYEKDPEYLFSPSNGLGRYERKIVQNLFPMNYSYSFDPSRITRISTFVRLLVSAKDNGTMLRTEIWNNLMELDIAIQNLTVDWEDSTYQYSEVCAKWNSRCVENPVLALNTVMPEIENGSLWVDYPIMLFPLILPFYYGGVEVNQTEGIVSSVQAIALTYWLNEDTRKDRERSILFEKKALRLLEVTDFENIVIHRVVSMSLEDELERNTNYVINFLPSTAFIVGLFSIISIFVCDWVRSKMLIGIVGTLTAGIATACSFGLLMYCEIPFIGINLAAPFLLLGIGLDDMFVLLSAWNRTNIHDNVPKRLAEAYSEAAVSITITSLTNILSFFIGAITPFPSVYIFCIYTGVAILTTYIFFITFFGGCLAFAGYQEQKQRHVLSCKPVKSKSESEGIGYWYSLFCAGGINKNDPWNPKDNRAHFLMTCFRDYFAAMLNYTFVKYVIICIFLAYLAGAVYGCLQIKEGLEKRRLSLDDSYLIDYYNTDDALFRKFPYRIQVIIDDNITYSDPKTKANLLALHENFEKLKYIGPKLYTQSWIRGFYRFLSRRPNLRKKITDEASFIKILKQEYLIPDTPEYLDVVFNENHTRIIASRFIIQSYEIKNTIEDGEMMQAVRRVAESAPFHVISYHPFFVLFDQFLLVKPLTIQTIIGVAAVMMLVSLILIPNPLCSLWVIFSIVSIEIGVMGYMSLWEVNLDCISMINLIMCIGFSVDFSAHISYAYLTAKEDSPDEKVKECMFSLGLPVVQSGLSTIAGVMVFVFAPSYIFQTFFKIILLVIVFGTMHAILLLPVMLSLMGPGSCKRKGTSESLSRTTHSGPIDSPDKKEAVDTNNDNVVSIPEPEDSGHGSLSSLNTTNHTDSSVDSNKELGETNKCSIEMKTTKECHGRINLSFEEDDGDNKKATKIKS